MRQETAAERRDEQSPREQLRRLIETLSLTRGQFTLASGRSSSYFFDLKPTMLHPDGIDLMAEEVTATRESKPTSAHQLLAAAALTECIRSDRLPRHRAESTGYPRQAIRGFLDAVEKCKLLQSAPFRLGYQQHSDSDIENIDY
jgi:hypothetical protein